MPFRNEFLTYPYSRPIIIFPNQISTCKHYNHVHNREGTKCKLGSGLGLAQSLEASRKSSTERVIFLACRAEYSAAEAPRFKRCQCFKTCREDKNGWKLITSSLLISIPKLNVYTLL